MLTQPLTRPLTRKIHRAQLTSIRYRDFDPLSLEPYLLFDAETSMLGNLENPTLDLDASDNGSLDVITATRAGIATFTAADGQIVTADPDTVRVDNVQGEELTPTVYQRIGYTDFSSGWSEVNVSKQSGNGYLSAPSAIITADATSGARYSYILDTGTYEHDTVYTGSFFIRRVSGNSNVYVDNYRSTSSESPLITLTDDWQKIEFTFTSPSDFWTRFGVFFSSGNSVGDAFEIAMPQVEEGTTATDFVPNTTGSPKFIASATYGPRVPMMLIEPSATNLITYSSSNQLNFALDNVSMTYNATSSPDGDTNGILFEQTGNNANNSAYNYSTLPTTDGDYCYSVFIKAADSTNIRFRHDNGVVETQDFNPQEMASGTVAGALNLKFEDVGNGWFRVSFTRSLSSAPYHRFQIYPDRNNTQKGVYIFGLQVETGSVATSYIPTSGGSVAERTRNADYLLIDGTNFSNFFNDSEGTIYCEFVYDFDPNYEYIYNIRQTPTDEIRNQMSPTIVRTRYVVSSSYDGVVTTGTIVRGSLNRHAFSYKTNNFRGSVNGSAEYEDLSGTASLSPVELQLGGRGNAINNIKLKRLIYWPTSSDSL